MYCSIHYSNGQVHNKHSRIIINNKQAQPAYIQQKKLLRGANGVTQESWQIPTLECSNIAAFCSLCRCTQLHCTTNIHPIDDDDNNGNMICDDVVCDDIERHLRLASQVHQHCDTRTTPGKLILQEMTFPGGTSRP